jgi:hypothetical protein
VVDAADSVENTSVAVVAIEVTILDPLMASILREVERVEVAIEVTILDFFMATILKEAERVEVASEIPEAETPLLKSFKIFVDPEV